MIRFIAVVVFVFSSIPAFAMPQFLQLYRNDPFRNPNVDGCITCHMSPEGGDARNAFGQAFESGGEQITPMLRAQFPDRFVYPILRVSDALTVHFSDPGKKQAVVETGGMKNLVDVDKTSVNGTAATNTTSPVQIATPGAAPLTDRRSEVPVDQYAREGAFFGSNIVNLPDGKPQKKGGVDFFIGHRFSQDVKAAGAGGLYGFDSSAVIAYGVRAGVTDRLSFSIMRSNLEKTISLGTAFQVSRQSARMPVTLQARAGADGAQNFGLFKKENNPFLIKQYQPYVQIVATRTFADRVSFTAVPSFAFNTRDDTVDLLPDFAFGINHNNTVSLGLGTGIRVLPTLSIVGEVIPRLWGFKGEITDRTGFSFGLQKATFRHTFELVVSKQQAITPAQTTFQGVDTLRIGFNIYRKIR
jgi:hypothetical protein